MHCAFSIVYSLTLLPCALILDSRLSTIMHLSPPIGMRLLLVTEVVRCTVLMLHYRCVCAYWTEFGPWHSMLLSHVFLGGSVGEAGKHKHDITHSHYGLAAELGFCTRIADTVGRSWTYFSASAAELGTCTRMYGHGPASRLQLWPLHTDNRHGFMSRGLLLLYQDVHSCSAVRLLTAVANYQVM